MARYYDQRCPDCDSCGWLGEGRYPDGRRYSKCEWYGYILHETVGERCEGRMTPDEVKVFKTRYARKKEKVR